MLPKFNRAYVISDVHLGGRPGFQMFMSGKPFKKFCYDIAKDTSADNPTLLLINGDFVDFLAEGDATYWNGGKAGDQLAGMSTRDGLQPAFDGLKRFLSRSGAHLSIVLGNHDLELALPSVKAQLVEILCNGRENRRGRIEFAFDGWGYRFQVGPATALATHGNEVDEYNFTRFDILHQIIREEMIFGESHTAKSWRPSAGTAFVIDAVNNLKKEFPFVDLLKPEAVTFLILCILAPQTLSKADEFAKLVVSGKRNEAERPSSERRFLHAETINDAQPAQRVRRRTAVQLLSTSNRLMREGRIDEWIYGGGTEADIGLLGVKDWVTSARRAEADLASRGVHLVDTAGRWIGNQLSAAGKKAHASFLQNAISPFLAAESFKVTNPGTADRELLAMVRGGYDVVFTGHTHQRRFVRRGEDDNRYLVNNGTWAGLMSFEHYDIADATNFASIYKLLNARNRSRLSASKWYREERPVAVLQQLNGNRTQLKLSRVDDSGALVDKDLLGIRYEAFF
jgi:UDP-2,3-diacylglucosamine pyrophosphatase LpxH